MPRKVTIIQGHPDPQGNRFCHALADAYSQGAKETGHEVRRVEVAKLDFPILRSQAEFEDGTPADDIVTAQQAIEWADHLVIIYPLWLGALPAMLKAFIEQVFRPGFAFEYQTEGWPVKRLKNRSARIVVTIGMPALAYRWFYGAHSLKSLERNILKFCGIGPVRDTLIGLVDVGGDTRHKKLLAKLEKLGRRGH